MSELISTVKQCLNENESKVKEIEERVDNFIQENRRMIIKDLHFTEPMSAPLYRSYSNKEDENFGNIFRSSFEEGKREPTMEAELNKSFTHEKAFPNLLSNKMSDYPPRENPFASRMDQDFLNPMAGKEPHWSPYQMNDYSQPATRRSPSFPEPMQHQYQDPALETKNKVIKGLRLNLSSLNIAVRQMPAALIVASSGSNFSHDYLV